MNLYIHSITITGRGSFPLDMLRYDRCFPASEIDANAIARTFEHHENWEITVSKYTDKRNLCLGTDNEIWNLARWASFNCYKK